MKKNLIVILSLIFAQYVFSQNEEITEVKNLIEKVSSWQNKQTDHIKKYTLTNWHFSAYYIGLMRAYKTTGNKIFSINIRSLIFCNHCGLYKYGS